MMGNIQSLDVQVPHEIVQYWGWFLAFGAALLLIGVVAIVRSVTATIVSMLFFGWLLVLACGIEIAQAVMVGHWAGFFHHLVAAVLFGVTGVLMVTRPVLSAEVADAHSTVLSCQRVVSVFWLNMGCATGLGLAGGGRNHRVCAGFARSCAMARLGALGDRAFYRNRPFLLRGCVDRDRPRPARKFLTFEKRPAERTAASCLPVLGRLAAFAPDLRACRRMRAIYSSLSRIARDLQHTFLKGGPVAAGSGAKSENSVQ